MSSIKDKNGMDLTEAEDNKRLQEYMEELYKKDLCSQHTCPPTFLSTPDSNSESLRPESPLGRDRSSTERVSQSGD